MTGGVLSGLGKGVALASIGKILSSRYKVVPIKCDGYLNVDPGTMSPIEHGEVFVLDDGMEVDMDFGHYERFLNVSCRNEWNLTMGKVFDLIREKERKGDYLGKTVQMVPHVSDFIKNYFIKVGEETGADIVLIEIGGTVGDLENELYIEAIKSLAQDIGKENVLFTHLTYVPIPVGVNEQKSKPTQQSVSLLKQRGIDPQIIIARCSQMLTDQVRKKIARDANLSEEEVLTGVDVDNIYKIPIILEKQGISQLLARKLNIPVVHSLDKWKDLILKRENAQDEITIAIAGKYTALEDSYASIIEAIHHCEAHLDVKVRLKWIETSEAKINEELLKNVHGVIVPGGFGARGAEGKISMIESCRKNKIPFLGICYGLQLAVVEFARNICNLKEANTTEVDPECKYPVIHFTLGQEEETIKGGTMRLGEYEAIIKEGSIIESLYDSTNVSERHRHRYEVNPDFHQVLREKGLVFSGVSPDGKLVEFIEIPKTHHPYFVATQAHPELKSKLENPAPMFFGLIKAAIERAKITNDFDQEKVVGNVSFEVDNNLRQN